MKPINLYLIRINNLEMKPIKLYTNILYIKVQQDRLIVNIIYKNIQLKLLIINY